MNYALEVLIRERQGAKEALVAAQGRLHDLDRAIAGLSSAPPDTVALYDKSAELPPALTLATNTSDEGEIVTADVELAEKLRKVAKAQREVKEAEKPAPVPEPVAEAVTESIEAEKQADPFDVGQQVANTATGEIGQIVSVAPQPGGVPVYEVDFDGIKAFRTPNKLAAVESQPVTAQENAGPKPWEEAPDPEPVKPKRRSNGDIARDNGVSLIEVEEWKGGGRITKSDIEAYAAHKKAQEDPATSPDVQEVDSEAVEYTEPDESDAAEAPLPPTKTFDAPW